MNTSTTIDGVVAALGAVTAIAQVWDARTRRQQLAEHQLGTNDDLEMDDHVYSGRDINNGQP